MPTLEVGRQGGDSTQGIAYEKTTTQEPPTAIDRPVKSPSDKFVTRLKDASAAPASILKKKSSRDGAGGEGGGDVQRDPGLAPTTNSSKRGSRATLSTTDAERISSIRHSSSLPSFRAQAAMRASTPPQPRLPGQHAKATDGQERFTDSPSSQFGKILTEIPTSSFDDLTLPGQVEFSKRGSILLGGKRANASKQKSGQHAMGVPQYSGFQWRNFSLPHRQMTTEEEELSQKVRSLYAPHQRSEARPPVNGNGIPRDGVRLANGHATSSTDEHKLHAIVNGSRSQEALTRKDSALDLTDQAEDWNNVNAQDVDRYGFIISKPANNKPVSLHSSRMAKGSYPRRRISVFRQQHAPDGPGRERNRLSKARVGSSTDAASLSTTGSDQRRRASAWPAAYTSPSGNVSRFRAATNKLPHNKQRRFMDEASAMLAPPANLADIAEDERSTGSHQTAAASSSLSRKERERDEKWRKMAIPVKSTSSSGGGMQFEFNRHDSKLIERTWKGIPDSWRATAWHSFLTASAKRRGDCLSDIDLRKVFHQLLDESSPDDVQIDLDVPRTISSHIMFRKRYSGGQRLLFRVLHCMSIFFPDIGYVQGMAALAATLLCFYDEEMTFVMLVRVWQLRGLELLYQSGFAGLMTALDEFEKKWLRQGELATRLEEFGISPTAYGTRWYLTLFNYSIPFSAQLRVWDVFFLLGEPELPYTATPLSINTDTSDIPANDTPHNTTTEARPTEPSTGPPPASFHRGLDILHAVSAALIDGMRDTLLASDFEGAMKCLTSWVPITDDAVLMKVVRAEWRTKGHK